MNCSKLLKKASYCTNLLTHLVFPRHCFYCEEPLLWERSLLCSHCRPFLEFVEEDKHCPFCFFHLPSLCPNPFSSPYLYLSSLFYREKVSLALYENSLTTPNDPLVQKMFTSLIFAKLANFLKGEERLSLAVFLPKEERKWNFWKELAHSCHKKLFLKECIFLKEDEVPSLKQGSWILLAESLDKTGVLTSYGKYVKEDRAFLGLAFFASS